MKAIILISEASLPLAKTLQRELPDTLIYTKNECEGCISITSCHRFIEEHFNDFDSIIFIGAMGICVRSIAGCIKNKYKDPAVVWTVRGALSFQYFPGMWGEPMN